MEVITYCLKNVVAEVIRGNWGAGDDWKQALTDAGYNMEVIRDLVNQTFDGNDYDLGRITEETWEASAAMAGYGDAISDVSTAAYFAGNPVMDLVDKLQRPTGRELLIESAWNIINGIASILKPIGEAWDEVFGSPSAESVYQLVVAFEKLTDKLNIEFSTSLKIKSAFKDIFSILKSLGSTAISLLDIGGMAIKPILSAFVSLLPVLGSVDKVLASVTNVIAKFFSNIRDGIRDTNAFGNLFASGAKLIISFFNSLVGAIKNFSGVNIDFGSVLAEISGFFTKLGSAMIDPNVFYKMGDAIKQFFSTVKGIITGELDIKDTGFNFVTGFIEGLKSAVKMAYDKIRSFGEKLLEKLREVLGIHSPSTETKQIGIYFVEGFLTGLREMLGFTWQTVKDFAIGIVDAFKEGLSATSDGDTSDIGENFMYKIANGLGNGIRIVINAIKQGVNIVKPYVTSFYNWLKDQTNNFDIETILGYFKTFASGKLALSASSFLNTLSGSEGTLSKFNSLLENVGDIIIDKISSFGEKAAEHSNGLLHLAEAIGILTLSLYGLANIPDFESQLVKLGELLAVIVSSYGAILALSKGFSAVAVDDGNGVGFFGKLKSIFGLDPQSKAMKQIGNMLLKLAASILILATAVKVMASVPEDDAGRSILYIITLIAAVTAVAKYLSTANGTLKGAGTTFLGLSVSMLILVTAIKKFAAISTGEFIGGAIKAFAMMMALAVAIRTTGKGLGAGTGVAFIALAASLLIIVKVMKQLADMAWGDLIKGLGSLLIMMTAMLFAGKGIANTAGGMKTAGLQMIALAAALLIITQAIKALGSMPIDELTVGLIAFGAAMAILCAAMKSLSQGNAKNVLASSASVILLGVGLILIAHSFEAVSALPWDGYAKGLLLMAATLLTMNSVAKLAKNVSFKDVAKSIGLLLVTIGSITAMMAITGFVDTATGGAISEAITSGISILETIRSGLFQMIIILLLFKATIIKPTKNLKYDEVLKSIGILVTVLAALSISLGALGGVDMLFGGGLVDSLERGVETLKQVRKSMLSMATIMLSFVAVFKLMKNITSNDVGTMSASIGKTLLAIAEVIAGLTVIFAAIGGLTNGIDFIFGDDAAINAIEKCGDLLQAITTAIGKAVGGLIGGSLSYIPTVGTYLSDFSANAAPFFDALKSLPQNSVNGAGTLVSVILKLAAAQFINGISRILGLGKVGMNGLVTSMETIGKGVKKFANATTGIKSSDARTATTVARVISELYTNLPKTGGWVQAIVGEQDLSKFGEGMQQLADGIVKFAVGIAALKVVQVTSDDINTAITIAQGVNSIYTNLPKTGGVFQDIFGDQDLSNFGNGMKDVADGIAKFAEGISALKDTELTDEDVNTALLIAQTLAAIENNLPETGGKIQTFFGEKSLANFGVGMQDVANGIKNFITALTGLTIDDELVNEALYVAQTLAALQNNLPETGGAIQSFFGEQDLTAFGNQMGAVGTGIHDFITNLGNVTITEDQVTMASNVGTMLANLEDSLTKHGGAISFFTGDTDFGTFGVNIGKVGDGLKSFSDNATNLDTDASQKAVDIAGDLSKIENSLKNKTWWSKSNDLGNFSTNVTAFGDALLHLNGVSNIQLTGVISSVKNLMSLFTSELYVLPSEDFESWIYSISELGTTLADFVAQGMTNDESAIILSNGVATMINTIANAINDNEHSILASAVEIFASNNGFRGGIGMTESVIIAKVKTILNLMAFTIKSYNNTYRTVAEGLFRDNFLVGIQTQSGLIITTAATIVQTAWRTIANYYGSFYSIGVQLMQGLANGISANRSAAINAAVATASQALWSSRNVLGIHSPSKEFWKIGQYSVLGMANGFDENSNLVASAAGEVGDEAMDVIVGIVQRIQDILDGNLEYTPTIRPIMDATNIQNGVSAINNMFANQNLGTLSNIGYINQMRADRGNIVNPTVQVDNSVVVDAINNVGTRIEKLEAAMYNMQIQMDGNATVGQIYNKMDKQLGRQAKYRERGI